MLGGAYLVGWLRRMQLRYVEFSRAEAQEN